MRFRCTRCGPAPKGFEFTDNAGACPRCNRSGLPAVVPLIDIHLVAFHQHGPILGSEGRQFVACQPRRDALARYPQDEYAATGDPREVTCPSCKATKEYKELASLFPEIAAREAMAASDAERLKAWEQVLKDCGCA